MDARHQLEETTKILERLMIKVTPANYDRPTPCAAYDLRALANHTIGAAMLFGAAARGEAPSDDAEDADVLGDQDPSTAFKAAAASMLQAYRADGVLERDHELPFATLPGEVAVAVAQAELLIHAWDIARATDQPTDFPAELAEMASATAGQVVTDDMRSSVTFLPATEAPAGASPADRLAAFAGRAV